jgi:hypothetical protein
MCFQSVDEAEIHLYKLPKAQLLNPLLLVEKAVYDNSSDPPFCKQNIQPVKGLTLSFANYSRLVNKNTYNCFYFQY